MSIKDQACESIFFVQTCDFAHQNQELEEPQLTRTHVRWCKDSVLTQEDVNMQAAVNRRFWGCLGSQSWGAKAKPWGAGSTKTQMCLGVDIRE